MNFSVMPSAVSSVAVTSRWDCPFTNSANALTIHSCSFAVSAADTSAGSRFNASPDGSPA
jgi:hypothetical protein